MNEQDKPKEPGERLFDAKNAAWAAYIGESANAPTPWSEFSVECRRGYAAAEIEYEAGVLRRAGLTMGTTPTRDDVLIAINRCIAPGVPKAAVDALKRAAVAIVGALFDGCGPTLDPPRVGVHANSALSELILANTLMHRWGAEEEMRRRLTGSESDSAKAES